jgi:hypothetical protein
MNDRRRNAATVLGVVAVCFGLAATVHAASHPFATSGGQQLWWVFAMNTLGGLVTLLFGGLAIAGARAQQGRLVLASGIVFLVAALITLLRTNASGNLLGGHAGTMSFFLMMGIGLVVLVVSPGGAGETREQGGMS